MAQGARSGLRALAAVLVSLVVPGLGHVIGRAWGRGWAWFGAGTVLGLVLMAACSLVAPTPWVVAMALVAAVLMVVMFNGAAAIDAWRAVRAVRAVGPVRWYRRGWVTVLAMLAVSGGVEVVATPLMGWRSFSIPSASMLPTLEVGDYLLTDTRWKGEMPGRGDVVVFVLPSDGRTDYIKRAIGLPGDRVQMKSGRLWINGAMVPRRDVGMFLAAGDGPPVMMRRYVEILPGGRAHAILEASDAEPFDTTREFLVPPGHFFAMGDNRDNSVDSRVPGVVGFVPVGNVVARAETRFWAVDWRRILEGIE